MVNDCNMFSDVFALKKKKKKKAWKKNATSRKVYNLYMDKKIYLAAYYFF